MVKGELPKKRDVIDWSEKKLLQFLRFVEFWIDENGNYKITNERRLAAEERAKDEPFWKEFLQRIDQPLKRKDSTTMKFQLRLMNFSRTPLTFMKQNPHFITEEMEKIMSGNPRMSWALKPFKMDKTKMGVEMVMPNNEETTDPRVKNAVPSQSNTKNPVLLYEESVYNLATLAKHLTSGLKKSDLNKLDTKDRVKLSIDAIKALATVTKKNKPNMMFKNLNVFSAKRDDLEQIATSYNQDQQQ